MKKFTEILILACALIFLGVTIWFNTQSSSIVGVATVARVPQGGTGWGSLQSNTVLLGNGTGKIATSTGSTNGFVLALESGVPTFVSTSSIGSSGSAFAWTPTADGNSTSTRLIFGNGFISQASSSFSGTGTTTFSGDIDVRGLQVTGTHIYGDTDVSHLTLSSVTGSHLGYHNGGGENSFVLTGGVAQFTLNGSEVSRFNSTGLGIFDTSPTYVLDVTGNAHFTSFADAAYFVATSTTASTFPKVSITEATTTSLSVTGLFNIGGDYLNELCGTGLTCTGNTLALNATGDWTGTIDSNNFAGGAIGAGELIYGGSAGSFSELAAGTNGKVLAMSGGFPAWIATTTFSGGLTYSAGNVTADLGTSIDLTGEVVDNFTDGSVLFWGTTAVAEDNANLSFNNSLNRLTSTYASSTAISATNGDFTNLTETNNKIKGSRYPVFTYASSSWASAGTTTVYLAPASIAQTWNTIYCDSSTFLGVSVYDSTNRMDYLVASSTVGTFTLTTNNSFTLGEKRRVDIGTSTALGTRVDIACSGIYTIN